MTRSSQDERPRSGGPREPHPFRETNDPGVAAMAIGGPFRSSSEMNALAATTGFLRSTRCAMPGCGRPREDPIHEPEDA